MTGDEMLRLQQQNMRNPYSGIGQAAAPQPDLKQRLEELVYAGCKRGALEAEHSARRNEHDNLLWAVRHAGPVGWFLGRKVAKLRDCEQELRRQLQEIASMEADNDRQVARLLDLVRECEAKARREAVEQAVQDVKAVAAEVVADAAARKRRRPKPQVGEPEP